MAVSAPAAGPWRRVGALLYDLLVVVALLIAATGVALLATGGEAIHPGTRWYQLYIALVLLAYFAGFWWRRGQTLGMVAWQLRLQSADGGAVSLGQCIVRWLAAIVSWGLAGVGFLWMLVDDRRRTWNDLASGTRIVSLHRLT